MRNQVMRDAPQKEKHCVNTLKSTCGACVTRCGKLTPLRNSLLTPDLSYSGNPGVSGVSHKEECTLELRNVS